MASNENPLGASPRRCAAIRKRARRAALLPGRQRLRAEGRRSSSKLGVDRGATSCSATAPTTCWSSWRARSSRRRFGRLLAARVHGLSARDPGHRARQHIVVPARGYGNDLEAMRAAVRRRHARSSSSPIRTIRRARFSPWAEIRALRASACRATCSSCSTRPTANTLPDELKSPTHGWIAKHPNLIVSRTFSKAYRSRGPARGLCSSRTPGVADLMNRVRQPFNVNHLAGRGGGRRSTTRTSSRRAAHVNAAGMRQLTAASTRSASSTSRRPAISSRVRVGDGAGASTGPCSREGVIVRPIAGYGMPEHLRVTVGLPRTQRALPRGARARRLTKDMSRRCARLQIASSIFGVGLIGGSFALAVRRAGAAAARGRRRPRCRANLHARAELGVIDRRRRLGARTAVRGADLVLLAVPVRADRPRCFATIAPHLDADTVVTDAGSTKRDVVAPRGASSAQRFRAFVPGASRSPGARRAASTRRSRICSAARNVVRHAGTPRRAARALKLVRSAWEAHRRARVSDRRGATRPHVRGGEPFAAPAVVHAGRRDRVARPDAAELLDFAAGGGFRDFTRIAAQLAGDVARHLPRESRGAARRARPLSERGSPLSAALVDAGDGAGARGDSRPRARAREWLKPGMARRATRGHEVNVRLPRSCTRARAAGTVNCPARKASPIACCCSRRSPRRTRAPRRCSIPTTRA